MINGISLDEMTLFGKHPVDMLWQIYKHYFAFNGSEFWINHRTCWRYLSGFNVIPHTIFSLIWSQIER